MKTCNPIEFWSNYSFFLKPTLMPLYVQYLDKSWIVKLSNFIVELLKLSNLTEEYAFWSSRSYATPYYHCYN